MKFRKTKWGHNGVPGIFFCDCYEWNTNEDLQFFSSKTIEIPIVEEDSYEKNVVMYCVIGEPKHLAGRLPPLFLLAMHFMTSYNLINICNDVT